MLLVAAVMASFGAAEGVERQAIPPFEARAVAAQSNPIDDAIRTVLHAHGMEPAFPCTDVVFFRRAYLDIIGTLPAPAEVNAFLLDKNPQKRAALIDVLLEREEFADLWALKWCDILRVKAEFPINLWPNAVQAYYGWIHDAIKANKPYDVFARELLTSSGSNFRVPPANFYRAIQGREPSAIAEAVALTFMGTRLAAWPEARRQEMAAFFSRVAYKKTGEWKEEIVCLNPALSDAFDAVYPDGGKVHIEAGQDPRVLFADWLIAPDNPWFARNVVNRIWAWLMGRGLIQEPDDIRADNPPSHPELLAYLERELTASRYDLRHIYRLILNSQTYQQSAIPPCDNPEAVGLFACYPVRRMDAEVLIDALCRLGGKGEEYSSAIPEPFTFVPAYRRSITLADGSITSSFLEMFGRPARDTGLESERNIQPTDAQRLYLLNSTDIQNKIVRSPRLMGLLKANKGNPKKAVRSIYMEILARPPTPDEMASALRYGQDSGLPLRQAAEDLMWALINSKEFLYRH